MKPLDAGCARLRSDTLPIQPHHFEGSVAMNKSQLLVTAGFVAIGLTLAACGGAEQQPASESTTTEAPAQTAQTPEPATEAAAYPIDWCIVSGEKLGAMGDPVPYEYKGKTVQFCCKQCVKIFEKSPDAFIARYDSAAAGLLMPPGEADSHEGHSH
jgi:YHS domain-containing protein